MESFGTIAELSKNAKKSVILNKKLFKNKRPVLFLKHVRNCKTLREL